MAKLTLTLTKEHLALLKWMKFQKIEVHHEKRNLSRNVRLIHAILKDMSEDSRVKNLENTDPYLSAYIQDGIEKIFDELKIVDDASAADKAYSKEDGNKYYGFDTSDLYGGNDLYTEMSNILGYEGAILPGSESDPDGPKFKKEIFEKMQELDEFILANLVEIEEIIHQKASSGGIQEGVKYVAYDHEHIWYTEDEWKAIGRR